MDNAIDIKIKKLDVLAQNYVNGVIDGLLLKTNNPNENDPPSSAQSNAKRTA